MAFANLREICQLTLESSVPAIAQDSADKFLLGREMTDSA